MEAVDEHGGELVALERRDLGVGDRQRHDQQAGDAVAAGEVAQRAAALLGRLDVEEHQVVLAPLAPPQPLDHAAQAFDHGRRGEERNDDADRHRAPDREIACGRVEPVAELVDRRLDPRPRRLQHQGLSLSTRETVAALTPAWRATSRIVGPRIGRQSLIRLTGARASPLDKLARSVMGSRM